MAVKERATRLARYASPVIQGKIHEVPDVIKSVARNRKCVESRDNWRDHGNGNNSGVQSKTYYTTTLAARSIKKICPEMFHLHPMIFLARFARGILKQ